MVLYLKPLCKKDMFIFYSLPFYSLDSHLIIFKYLAVYQLSGHTIGNVQISLPYCSNVWSLHGHISVLILADVYLHVQTFTFQTTDFKCHGISEGNRVKFLHQLVTFYICGWLWKGGKFFWENNLAIKLCLLGNISCEFIVMPCLLTFSTSWSAVLALLYPQVCSQTWKRLLPNLKNDIYFNEIFP